MSSDKSSAASVVADEANNKSSSGGLAALSGFYFQFIGSLAHTALELTIYESASDTEEDVETLFGIEIGDGDYQKQHGRKIDLVQFKYSANPKANSVNVAEHYKITRSLALQKKRIEKSDSSIIVRCVLATNRLLGDDVEAVKSAFDKDPTYALPQKGRYRSYMEVCEYQHETSNDWNEMIQTWGHRFAMTNDEIKEGMRRVNGEFLARSNTGRRLFGRREAELAFVGFAEPRNVTAMHKKSQGDIDLFFPKLEVPDLSQAGHFIAPRRNLLEVLNRAIVFNALVALVGPGGNGKSTLLAEALREQSKKCFVLGEKVGRLQEEWLTQSVSNWRRADKNLDIQNTGRAIARLENLNEAKPILVIALDALDEVDLQENHVQNLVYYFSLLQKSKVVGQPVRATLLLTCRSQQELNRFLGDPAHSYTIEAGERVSPEYIEVEDFDVRDMAEALEKFPTSAESLKKLVV